MNDIECAPDVERTDDDLIGCLRRYDPRKHPEDFFVLLAITFMSVGMAMIFVGMAVPRDYEFDPTLPAREMERIEMRYAALSFSLDVCVVVGMGFVTIGGIIVSVIFTKTFLGVQQRVYRARDRDDLDLLQETTGHTSTYGSNDYR